MVLLYHVNHSCDDCEPGTIFDLLAIKIEPGSPHEHAYQQWKNEFPAGLSVFGYRHMTPDQRFGEVPRPKIDVEWQCDLVRRKHFSHLPSRYQAFFALASLSEAIAFRDSLIKATGTSGSIWEVEADAIYHRGDMRLISPDNYDQSTLHAYWEGKAREGGTPVWECLVKPPIKMVQRVLAK